jgi:hypothetical protein
MSWGPWLQDQPSWAISLPFSELLRSRLGPRSPPQSTREAHRRKGGVASWLTPTLVGTEGKACWSGGPCPVEVGFLSFSPGACGMESKSGTPSSLPSAKGLRGATPCLDHAQPLWIALQDGAGYGRCHITTVTRECPCRVRTYL